MTAAHASFTNGLAVYIEVMTINDTGPITTDKRELGFRIIESFKVYNQSWKKIPPQLQLMLLALRKKYGERPRSLEKWSGITVHT